MLIMLDDMNQLALPPHDLTNGGHPDAQVPSLDRMAANGMVMSSMSATTAACNPSRVAMIMGMGAGTTGILENNQEDFRAKSAVLAPLDTMFQHFKNAGYRTSITKHVFHYLYDEPNTVFDEIRKTELSGGIDGPDPSRSVEFPVNSITGTDPDGNGVFLPATYDLGPIEVTGDPDVTPNTNAYLRAQWAASQVRAESHHGPMFVAVGIDDTHIPHYSPRKYWDQFAATVTDVPFLVNDTDDIIDPIGGGDATHAWLDFDADNTVNSLVKSYLASMTFVDDQVKLILDATDAADEEWIIIVSGDHGVQLGQKRRTGKGGLWEPSVGMAFMISGPGIPAGVNTNMPVSIMDIWPTLAELTGVAAPLHLEGTSIVPMMLDSNNTAYDIPRTTWATGGHKSYRSRQYRMIVRSDSGATQLYDHYADPNEHQNLAYEGTHDDVMAWMLANSTPDNPNGVGPAPPPD